MELQATLLPLAAKSLQFGYYQLNVVYTIILVILMLTLFCLFILFLFSHPCHFLIIVVFKLMSFIVLVVSLENKLKKKKTKRKVGIPDGFITGMPLSRPQYVLNLIEDAFFF